MEKSKPFKYTGSLSKTIAQKRIGLLAGEDAYRAEAQRTTDEMFAKLPDLFKAHQVPEGNWVALTLALAKSHVPGFKVVKPAGRRTEWGIADKAEFRLDVDIVIGDSKLSVVEAIKLVCRLDAWKEKTAPMKISALEQHYYRADMRFI
ncbi:hypothetical protein [Polaromonas sp.]|uniref:hypothetical protein n=1 Tax=Polaromonas sp. TaxID=1869339 RepID=UPI001831074C|nr:hypothetical protein [Polaromonas sp.]NML85381.1 hypothetical protein [Polaromonas sp.]